MQKPVTFIITLLCVITLSLNAQTVKPAFKKLTYVTYEINGVKKRIVNISSIVEIDANGKVHQQDIYYNGVADTVYQLNENSINKLNGILNGKRPLKGYIVQTELGKNEHYGGSYKYVAYATDSGKKEEIAFIHPFMAAGFNDAFENLSVSTRKQHVKRSIDTATLATAILRAQKLGKDLQPIQQPPPGM